MEPPGWHFSLRRHRGTNRTHQLPKPVARPSQHRRNTVTCCPQAREPSGKPFSEIMPLEWWKILSQSLGAGPLEKSQELTASSLHRSGFFFIIIASLKATWRESHKAGRLVEKPQVTGWIDSCLNKSDTGGHTHLSCWPTAGRWKESVQLRAGFTGSLQGGVFWWS